MTCEVWFYHLARTGLDQALLLEANYFGLLTATEDMREGTKAFLDKRKPVFRGV